MINLSSGNCSPALFGSHGDPGNSLLMGRLKGPVMFCGNSYNVSGGGALASRGLKRPWRVWGAPRPAGAPRAARAPPWQGAATKAQGMDLSPGFFVVFSAPPPALVGFPFPVSLFFGLASQHFQVPLQAAARVSGATSIPPIGQVCVLAVCTVGHVESKVV